MFKPLKKLVVLLPGLILSISLAMGQNCETARQLAYKELLPFIPDGLYRKAELSAGESKTYKVTFYGKRAYRVSTALDNELGNVRWKLKSSGGKLLFDSKNTGYRPSMKIKFNSTSTFDIEVSLPEGKSDGCAVLLIGFEAKE